MLFFCPIYLILPTALDPAVYSFLTEMCTRSRTMMFLRIRMWLVCGATSSPPSMSRLFRHVKSSTSQHAVDLHGPFTRRALLFYMYMMFIPHRKHTYWHSRPVTGIKSESKAIPVTGRGGLLRIPHCLGSRLTDGGKVVSPTHRPLLYFSETLFLCFWYSFLLEAE
jgi:hypothetical protein